ncbi:hypothetical protein [Spartinivicinus poritis]|uniref:Uncharacterized protein n=1 Tax=Spartinivicinus poritis TaxID=2994640 RepID=A0ABT5U7G0_9GAMM|nr:hypothetical protein [Spartinivicinus sp. A2-2]MDE1462135.1 hypothetical protein [Spartinivicinus sp. A2-2]
MATIRWSLNRQSQLLQQGAEVRIADVSNKLEVLHVDFKDIIRHQEKHLHEIEKQLLSYQKDVAETYMKKEESVAIYKDMELKVDKIRSETKNYYDNLLNHIDNKIA